MASMTEAATLTQSGVRQYFFACCSETAAPMEPLPARDSFKLLVAYWPELSNCFWAIKTDTNEVNNKMVVVPRMRTATSSNFSKLVALDHKVRWCFVVKCSRLDRLNPPPINWEPRAVSEWRWWWWWLFPEEVRTVTLGDLSGSESLFALLLADLFTCNRPLPPELLLSVKWAVLLVSRLAILSGPFVLVLIGQPSEESVMEVKLVLFMLSEY